MALQAYTQWKASYVVSAGNGMLRVIRPQNHNDTVSEGIGYGMLFAAYAHDQSTFQGLWTYAQHYQDSHGLMNWKISQSGQITGTGSASDADEDITYALGLASQQWPGHGYHQDFLHTSQSLLHYDVLPDNLMGPGDQWGAQNTIVNPSYMDPGYYTQFAQWTSNPDWTTIANTTNTWLLQHANTQTGLLPDWLNTNGTAPNISWDEYPHALWYDAIRVPMRLEFSAQHGDSTAQHILAKEDTWLQNIPPAHLVAGYTLSGQGLTSYINDTFYAGYTAIAQAQPQSADSLTLDHLLWNRQPTTYYSASLRLWELFQLANADS
jgi:endo-1,4-beta-D-glucanase Y